jgi:hypothetical protein
MTRCDQMKQSELYGCDHCGFDPLVLRGHGKDYPIGSDEGTVAQPAYGG